MHKFPGRLPEERDNADLPRILRAMAMEDLLATAQAMRDPTGIENAMQTRPLLVEEILRAQEKRHANR